MKPGRGIPTIAHRRGMLAARCDARDGGIPGGECVAPTTLRLAEAASSDAAAGVPGSHLRMRTPLIAEEAASSDAAVCVPDSHLRMRTPQMAKVQSQPKWLVLAQCTGARHRAPPFQRPESSPVTSADVRVQEQGREYVLTHRVIFESLDSCSALMTQIPHTSERWPDVSSSTMALYHKRPYR